MSRVPPVIHLVISLAAGGLERLVVDWTNARNRMYSGSTAVCCLDEGGEFASQVYGFPPVCLNANRAQRPCDIRAVFRLRELLCRNPNVVLHSHNAAAWQYGVLGCVGLRTRHIHTEHGSNPHVAGLGNRVRNACLWRLTDVVVAVAESAAQDLAREQGIPVARIRTIANGIAIGAPAADATRIGAEDRSPSQAAAAMPNLPEGVRVIGSVGRLAQVKGYDRLIRAFATLCKEHRTPECGEPRRRVSPSTQTCTSSAVLLLVGDGPERQSLEELAAHHDVAEHVIFAGYQDQPVCYLKSMDLFVLPSRSEGLSISLLEAMAAGVPVAATDVGANREVLADGECGLLLPEDEEQWTGILMRALRDAGATRHRREAALSRVRERYSLNATLAAYERLYAGNRDATG